MFDVGDHVRAVEPDRGQGLTPGAVYRVVGCPGDDEVVVLRVTGSYGRRAYSGTVVRCSRPALAEAVVPAENPDAGLAIEHRVRTFVTGLVWSLRRFL